MKNIALALALALLLAGLALATTKEDIFNTDNFIKTYVAYDPYPTKLIIFAAWMQSKNVDYMMTKRVDDEQLYMYTLSVKSFGDTNATELWSEAVKVSGTATSKVVDIGTAWDTDADFLKAIGEE